MPGRAPWSSDPARSRGRLHPEAAPAYRSEFQRDRDRIVHSSAFRRLEYKTQVFLNHEGDMFRTRLTHSLEVAQLGRTMARALGLDEDLVEAIALAHDLGHTPFGHAGQEALDGCMQGHGGFEHNFQSLRVIDRLERRYAAFAGLNLTFETREGVLKRCSRARAATLGQLGRRFLEGTQPGLEAQLANIADEIAYNSHDVDDGLRSGLLTLEQLEAPRITATAVAGVRARHPALDGKLTAAEALRRMIDSQVTDLVETTRARLVAAAPADADAVRHAPGPLVGFSASMLAQHVELKRFLRAQLYDHPQVRAMTAKAAAVVRRLFEVFRNDPALLPAPEPALPGAVEPATGTARRVADHIAGMTDRYAIAEHVRLVGPTGMH